MTDPQNATSILAALESCSASGDADFLAAVIMPDHVHVLLSLGARLRLGQLIGKIKSLSRQQAAASWTWQEDYFEHRLRPEDSIEDYGFYMFMNPYKTGLVALETPWPWWICWEPRRFRFLAGALSNGGARREWLLEADRCAERISIRE